MLFMTMCKDLNDLELDTVSNGNCTVLKGIVSGMHAFWCELRRFEGVFIHFPDENDSMSFC